MAFIVQAMDRAGGQSVRQAHRAAHLAFLANAGAVVLLAGPLLSDEGAMVGSLLIVDHETVDAVTHWLADDPYTRADLFETVSVKAFKPVITNFRHD